MSQLSLLQLDLKDCIQENPSLAVSEDAIYYDTANTASVAIDFHKRLKFPQFSVTGGGVANPTAIWETILPTPYTGTTGLTLVFMWYAELPTITGNVVWEFSAQTLTAATTSHTITLDAWGTPAVASGQAAATVSGQFVTQTINMVKANVGNANPAVGSIVRVRLRRLNSTSGGANANDTMLAPAYIVGSLDLQGY